MTNTDVKQRITSLQQLPVLPHLAREILLSLDAGSVHWEELAAIAAFDEEISSTLRSASIHENHASASAPLEDHMLGLGIARVCELVFAHVAPGLFDEPRSHGIDLKGFWTHAFTTARYARTIAVKINSRYEGLAYVAGLLHDIGKPALDRVVVRGYTRALELVRQQGLYALEAERRELGADHTVAGKWLAEAWGLPATLVAPIWLHHHPPGTLDNTPYPVQLIEIVALANFLAHGDELEAPPQERVAAMDEQRWMRLGLERLDVIEMLRASTEVRIDAPKNPSPRSEMASRPDLKEDVSRIRQERDYYEALCILHERLEPGLSPAGQLTLLIEALRQAFAIPAGLCYLTDDRSGAQVVLRWHTLQETPEVVPLREEGGERAAASLDELIAALGGPRDASGRAPASAVQRHGFMALPLFNSNRSVGQLIFQSGQGGPTLSEVFLNSLMRFMKAAGAAMARCNAVRGANEEAESLAAAVWKQELTHRHDRKTERLISVGKMAAGAAHEINNPLAVISGKAQLLLGSAQRPEDQRALEVIIEHSQRASGILRDLLQFARPNPPQLMPSRLSYLLQGTVDRVRKRLEDEGIQLVEDYAQDLPMVQIDRVQMEQVFQNILKNAEQAMARQGDKLTIRVRPNQDRTAVIIQFIDTGQGIPADVMDKVFEPFFTTHSGNEGTGMGLAVCHGIVDAHRGTITLHSQEGSGTTCTLTLPVAIEKSMPSEDRGESPQREARDPHAAATTERTMDMRRPAPGLAPEVEAALLTRNESRLSGVAPQVSTPSAPTPAPVFSQEPATPPVSRVALDSKGSLLLVDNDSELREVLAEALRSRGYRVRTASDGLEALAEVIANRVDLVMLDGNVPGAYAPQALVDEIQKRRPDIPVILLIGAAATYDESVGFGSGTRQVLRKPFEVAHLFRTIEESIASRHVA
jgi:signal transduction histidine kinase/HD-like signal output (HDOD) protein/CheY-like chemotaxis protein